MSRPQLVRSLALFGPLLSPPDAARPGLKARGEKARSEGEAGMQAIADGIVQGATSSETRARQPAAVAMVREIGDAPMRRRLCALVRRAGAAPSRPIPT